MQVQIQRGFPLAQSELELPGIPWHNIEGGSMLKRKEALETDRSQFELSLCHF